MIISASYRTDIPAFYGPWFAERLKAGFCTVANPYGGKPSRVSLTPEDVDAFVFWTRNLRPFLPILETLRTPFVVQYTGLGYPAALDPGAPSIEQTIAVIQETVKRYGKGSVVWRYDPIVFSDITPPAWHRTRFTEMAKALSGVVDEVVFSIVQPYRKTARNLDKAANAHGFSWRDPEPDEKHALLAELTALAHDHGLTPTLCAQPDLLVDGLKEAACIDAARLSRVAGREITAKAKPHRDTCRCVQSRDIGAYDTCVMGCAYCYAVQSPDAAKRRHAAHDVMCEML